MTDKRSTAVVLDIRELVKEYPRSQEAALKGLSLSINEAEVYGLLGPNGSGKTTTISIACGFLKSTAGKVTILGRDVRKEFKKIKPFIGFVPQEIALYPRLTLKENLTYFGSMHGLRGRKLSDRIDFCVKTAQLPNFINTRVDAFSGGMKRRANLVVGILHDPKVLFLDEPTVGVDPQSKHVIFEALSNLRQSGMTMLYTTHYMEEAQKFCTHLGIIDEGKIITEGTPKELIKNTANCSDLGEVFLALTGKQLRDK
ncbi:ABC transporter ATP-binding protein [bacterium]|nr:ABC transporter ATP-binding protein [bacterium]